MRSVLARFPESKRESLANVGCLGNALDWPGQTNFSHRLLFVIFIGFGFQGQAIENNVVNTHPMASVTPTAILYFRLRILLFGLHFCSPQHRIASEWLRKTRRCADER